jgi:ferredoxin-NADP reductase
MASPYRPYVLSEIVQETDEVRSFVFTPADGQPVPPYRAGQFFMLRITDVPNLKPPMRSYSAARAYRADSLSFGIKLHGPFTHALFEKKKGDKIEISGPYGFFTIAENNAPIVLLAAGIGITPLLCMSEELAEKKDGRQAKLFYSNRELHRAPYIEFLEGLQAANPNFEFTHTITCDPAPEGWGGECGRINAEMLKRHGVDFGSAHFYFCGPKDFNDSMTQLLQGAGVAKERIHKEAW